MIVEHIKREDPRLASELEDKLKLTLKRGQSMGYSPGIRFRAHKSHAQSMANPINLLTTLLGNK